MKKNKLSNAPSQNTSPVPYRKSYNDAQHTIGPVPTVDNVTSALSRSMRLSINNSSNSTNNDYEAIPKDPEYETIPADVVNATSTHRNATAVGGAAAGI